jgi:hypothetical protein
MPGEKPKGQHFVHRAYLEGFQDPVLLRAGRRALWVYMPGKEPISQVPDRVAKRNYYYCYRQENERKFHVEHGLQKLEDAALPILLRLREGDFKLSPEDRLTFAGYAALSYTRVPSFERVVNRIAAFVEAKRVEFIANDRRTLKTIVAKIEAKTGEKTDVDDFYKKLTGGSAYVTQTDRGWSIKQMLETMMSLQKLIFQMRWCFLKAPSDSDGFLTSDNPVSLFDPVGGPGGSVGFASSPAAHFTFPISKEICLLAQHHPNPPSLQLTPAGVRQTNTGTITRADRQLYAPFSRRAVSQLFERVAEQKKSPSRVLFRQGRVVEE